MTFSRAVGIDWSGDRADARRKLWCCEVGPRGVARLENGRPAGAVFLLRSCARARDAIAALPPARDVVEAREGRIWSPPVT